jgi:mitochondrial fission protein ELM1
MLELKAILLTQGMHGMVSQVEGLAKALNLTYKHQTIKLKPFWNFIPPKISPISENLVKNKFVCDSKIIISCGRKSVIPSIALKKRLGKEIFTIHIQNPKVSYKHFDLIVSPEHDNIKGDNVIATTGAIHYLTRKEIKENSNYLGLKEKKKKLVAFIIGGPNKYYAYTEQVIHQTFNKVKTLFTPDKYKIIVIPSYRTPKEVIKKAYDTFNFNHHVVKEVDKKAYLSALAISDHIVVTCDSTFYDFRSSCNRKTSLYSNDEIYKK